MKVILAACLLCAVSASIEDDWIWMKSEYGKTYTEAEDAKRFTIFSENAALIKAENAKGNMYTLGYTEFADLTFDEFKATYGQLRRPKNMWRGATYLGRHKVSGKTRPTSVDWSQQGAVTPIKDQGQCGSCWAFSSTGSLEGRGQIASGQLVSLSEQQFVDCAGSFGNQGCNGGLMDNAFQYAESNALCTETSYSYTGTAGTCAASSCTTAPFSVSGYKDVTKDDTDALLDAVAEGPVSIAVDAASAWQLYTGGIMKGTCGASLDHGVLAAGYGTDNGVDYWKVKNSWGSSWGEDGYIRLVRKKSAVGECGLLSGPPSYPVIKGTESNVFMV
jgi:cathepsin L